MVNRIDAALAETAPQDGARPSALLYISGDLVTGRGTLLDELITHVGLRDAAADYGLQHTGRLPLETILGDPPQLIMARSEEHTSELQSLMRISYAVFCLKKKITTITQHQH